MSPPHPYSQPGSVRLCQCAPIAFQQTDLNELPTNRFEWAFFQYFPLPRPGIALNFIKCHIARFSRFLLTFVGSSLLSLTISYFLDFLKRLSCFFTFFIILLQNIYLCQPWHYLNFLPIKDFFPPKTFLPRRAWCTCVQTLGLNSEVNYKRFKILMFCGCLLFPCHPCSCKLTASSWEWKAIQTRKVKKSSQLSWGDVHEVRKDQWDSGVYTRVKTHF